MTLPSRPGRDLQDGPYWPAGAATIPAIDQRPTVRWQLCCSRPYLDRQSSDEGVQLIVSRYGLVVAGLTYRDGTAGSCYSPIAGEKQFSIFDPENGVLLRATRRPFQMLTARTVISGAGDDTVAEDIVSGARVSSPPLPVEPAQPPKLRYDGVAYQTVAVADGVTYHAGGTVVTALSSDGRGSDGQGSDRQGSDGQGSDGRGSDGQGGDAQGGDGRAVLWRLDLAELLEPALTRDDRYPADTGDRGFGVRLMTPTPGRLYVLTSGRDLVCLQQPSPADPPPRPSGPAQVRRPPEQTVPPDVARATSYQHCARVIIIENDATCQTVMLCGDQPYTARLVYEQLTARGHAVVEVVGGLKWWAVVGRSPRERYRLDVAPFGPEWYRVLTDRNVIARHSDGEWVTWWRREDDLYDDDRFLHLDRETAERISAAMGDPLPPESVLDAIAEHAWDRMRKHHGRGDDFYRRRGSEFRERREQVRAELEKLDSSAPRVVVCTSAQGAADHVDEIDPVEAPLDEAIPLARALYGPPPEWRRGSRPRGRYLVNRLRLPITGEPVIVAVYADIPIRDLEYLAVTPFCPEEGYQIDEADSQADRRATKLAGSIWGHVERPELMFPISPSRLHIRMCPDRSPHPEQLPYVEALHIEIVFPNGDAYLAAPQRTRIEAERDNWFYSRFVPVSAPLAFVPGIGPDWVSINIPANPNVLKTLSIRLRHLPLRPHPGAVGYTE